MQLIDSFFKSKFEKDTKAMFNINFYRALQNMILVVLLFTVQFVRGREHPPYEWRSLSCFEVVLTQKRWLKRTMYRI